MDKLYIQSFRSVFLDPENEAGDLQVVNSNLNKRAARRMSRIGMMLRYLLEGEPLDLSTTLIFGTSFSESNALVSYLDSFPYASPTAFQTSIHPGGIEQALILNKQEVGVFLPLAGGQDLMARMLTSALASDAPSVIVCGGEEKGGWLRDYGLAYDRSMAFAMRFSQVDTNAIGELQWDRDDTDGPDKFLRMEEAVRACTSGGSTEISSGGNGRIRVVTR